jgi:urease accessory protein
MRDCPDHEPPTIKPAWHASLRLRFAFDAGVTRLTERAHSGPLRVQKPLYPEDPAVCHAIIVHPPGGVAGGDELAIAVDAGAATHVFLTTPGASKWYRSGGAPARQRVRISAGPGSAVEWLPQESIVFNDAQVEMDHEVELAADASYIGSEILCFGRRAAGERFARGTLRQRTRIRRGGRLLWWEQGALAGGAEAMDSPLGLAGSSVCATLVGIGRPLPAALVAQLRAADPALAVTQMKSVFVARHLGDDSEAARAAMNRVWQVLRPHLLGRAAQAPRIWNT